MGALKLLLGAALPPWVLPLVCAIAFALYSGWIWHKGEVHGTAKLDAYQAAELKRDYKVLQARVTILHDIEVRYMPAKARIITQIETITKEVPVYVTAADNTGCTVPDGFVRIHDAAWSGDDPAPPGELDRKPAGISLAQIAETSAHNAGACRQWREQALALRLAYEAVRVAGD